MFSHPGICLGLEVHQSPSELIIKTGDRAQIFCLHEKTDYRVMLWYQRPSGHTAMKLVGHIYYVDLKMEEVFKENFAVQGDMAVNTAKNGSLIVQVPKYEHSAVYYCAAHEAH